MKLAVICLVLLAIAAIEIVVAEDQSVPDGTIYGHVYDAQTKQPISGAWVYSQGTECSKQVTDSIGYYAIENCFSPSSTYNIECTKNGYPTAKTTAKTDSSGKAEVDFNLGNNPSHTQVKSWKRTFGGSGDYIGNSVQQTSDDGYIITGRMNSVDVGGNDILLIKTDENGNKLWEKTFGKSNIYGGKSVQQTGDGGYIITGGSEIHSANMSDVRLIKTDINGNKLWDKTFGGSNFDEGESVQQTRDGGYIVAGDTNGNFWLIKTDTNGNRLWDKIFGTSGNGVCSSVQQANGGGYIITGSMEGNIWLIKTDANGNKLWDRTLGGSGYDIGKYIQQTSDGGYIIGGTTAYGDKAKNSFIEFEVLLIKTDANGNELWYRTFGRSGMDMGLSIKQTIDEGYIISGSTSRSADYSDAWLVKTDANGNKVWDKTFSGGCGSSVQQASDGGFIITGYSSSPSAGKKDILLIKTDSEGNCGLEA